MKEQIEEMAKAICGLNTSDGCFCDGGYCNYNCLSYEKAEALYNAGYRKQKKGVWKIIKPRRENRNATYICSVCGALCSSYYNDVGEWKYCPKCGSRMKGGAE